MTNRSQPPPGWYLVGDSERYWDGQAWTDQVRSRRSDTMATAGCGRPRVAAPAAAGTAVAATAPAEHLGHRPRSAALWPRHAEEPGPVDARVVLHPRARVDHQR